MQMTPVMDAIPISIAIVPGVSWRAAWRYPFNAPDTINDKTGRSLLTCFAPIIVAVALGHLPVGTPRPHDTPSYRG
jgi:hypothetical protein